MNEEYIAHLIKNRDKQAKEPVRDDLTEEEFLEVYNDLVEFFASRNLSYGCVTRISVAWTDAIVNGAVQIYQQNP